MITSIEVAQIHFKTIGPPMKKKRALLKRVSLETKKMIQPKLIDPWHQAVSLAKIGKWADIHQKVKERKIWKENFLI